MSGSLELLTYASISVSSMIVVLAVVHYYRLRHDQYLVLAAGGVAYVCAWSAILIGQPLVIPHSYDVIEIIAMFLWTFAYCWKDRDAKSRIVIMALVAVAVSVPLQVYSPSLGYPLYIDVIFAVFKIVLVLYSVAYAVSYKAPGRHYFVQANMFFLISIFLHVLSVAGVGERAGGSVLNVFQVTAAGFGAVSILLFVDALTATRGGQKKRQEMMARVYEMIPEITRQLQTLHDVGATEHFFTSGIKLVALTIEKNFGYTKIFIGQQDPGERGMKLESCIGDPGNAPVLSSIKLPETIVSEVLQTRHPILISETSADPRTLMDKSYELLGVGSFALVPFLGWDDSCILMFVGDKTDGMPVDENDAALLDIISARIAEVFEVFMKGPDADVPSDLDSVTMLRNFSSFQRLLTEKVAEADMNSGSFVLLFLDTDKFSVINEELGYESGDQILRHVGEQLVKHVDPGMAGRVGADEFAVLLPNEGDNMKDHVEKILSELNQDMKKIGDGRLSLSAAYSIYPYDFLEQTGVFGKMREMLTTSGSLSGKIVRVKVG